MPLGRQFPKLDDRNYDEILAEIRARVSRYTPEWKPAWNDLNDNDPGMMLAQMFAWLSEMMLYRMNRVPELNYLKFLELIGIELRPAKPAVAEIGFKVARDWPNDSVDVPARTQVSATAADGKPLIFETLRPLRVAACTLENVQVYDGAQYLEDATPRNETPAEGFRPFGDLPRDGGALTLGFSRPGDKPFPALTLELAFWSVEAGGKPDGDEAGDAPPRIRTCGPVSSRSLAPASLQWEGWDGTRWVPLDSLNDETFAFTRSGHVWVRVPPSAKLKRDFMGARRAGEKLFWLRARLTRTQYERPPQLLAVRINTVPAEQAQTVMNEILGGANGRRNQTWQLANFPVIAGTLQIEIDEGMHEHAADTDEGKRERAWEVVDDLFGADRKSRKLALNRTSGEILAGDGEHGDIPAANPSDPDGNVVAVEYRYGGGATGNVPAGEIKNLLTSIEGLNSGGTGNVFPASGGRDEELLSEAERRARLALRARDRAVTPEDFETLAMEAGNVRRAKALARTHPGFPDYEISGAITVIVVPDSLPTRKPNSGMGPPIPIEELVGKAPVPGEGLLRQVCKYLDERRLLTTELYVVAPHYVSLRVQATVVMDDDANDRGQVKQEVERALAEYFHPLIGGDNGSGWPFGGALRYSKIVQRAFVEGVNSVPNLKLTVAGDDKQECTDALLEKNALLRLDELAVEVLTRQEFEEVVA